MSCPLSFPPAKTTIPGFEPIIGQAGAGAARMVNGMDPLNPLASLSVPEFVVSNGGEYFFAPSISQLKHTVLA